MNRPGKIVCVGRNYIAHAKELGNTVPETPLLFFKPPSSVIGPGDSIQLPPTSKHVEHEAEIGVLVGQRMRHVREEEALRGVAGFTCVNDVTARDIQRTEGQWVRAKGFDTFCPIGPTVLPMSDVEDWKQLEVICRVNGAERQRGHARDMAFGIPYLVAHISEIMTLEPGDLIATGSPAGVSPLRAGDVVEIEIPGVGILTNPVVPADAG